MVHQFIALIILLTSNLSFADGRFPLGPDPALTPGALCQFPTQRRYPEGIKYCQRNVDTSTKWEVIREYDRELGYQIEQMDRTKFKIDHYIPLCMGGDNDRSNLWPQHESVYRITDPLEQQLCEKMAQGRLLQKDAIVMIRKAKQDVKAAKMMLSEMLNY